MNRIKQLESFCVESVPLVNIYRMSAQGYPMNNRGRWHHGLLFPIKGTEFYGFRDGVLEASPGTVLYIPKGEAYRIDLEGEESEVICIDVELTCHAEPPRPMRFALSEIPPLHALFADANLTWKRNLPGRDVALKAAVYQIIAALIFQESAHASSEQLQRLAPAMDYMRTHYTDPELRMDELARMAGMSRRYFEKLFFSVKGTTPREYLLRLKMELARELLLNERLSVSDVAAALGYSDVYHFSKIFKKKNDKTPTEYKREHLREPLDP